MVQRSQSRAKISFIFLCLFGHVNNDTQFSVFEGIQFIIVVAMNFLLNLTVLAANVGKLPVQRFEIPEMKTLMAKSGFAHAILNRNVNVNQQEYTPMMGYVEEKTDFFKGSGTLLAIAIAFDLVCIAAFVIYLRPCYKPDTRDQVHSSLYEGSL